MEWLTQIKGQIIGLDTAPLIYFIEQNPNYLTTMRTFFKAMNQGELQVVTSVLTLTEVLVHPLRLGNTELAQQYRNIILNQENLITLPISAEIAELAAELRATQNLRTPDAIQIATALQGKATFFLTNDLRLKATCTRINVICLDSLTNY